ncbi:hypothetical protein N5079_16735 [Planotetraspora sp. A-T 1434]|uniref:hypothetical protein n=1 Tax=Planotetraspora sp. A-T 1434 TaxID=2979219 RepID=UPI0021C21490|nr:hypothetical protein [Planotetraspora sp. A-T 1434]MCT9931858.1 hypothetical protein [Planotetraspora sp. A-T 1434]
MVPAPQGIDEAEIRKRHESKALEGVSIFKRGERAQAKDTARFHAEQEIAHVRQQLAAQRMQWQSALDERWKQLCANHPDVVLETLAEAFDDNEAPAAAVGALDGEVALAVLVPGTDAVPSRFPSVTEAGNISLRQTPKKYAAAFYAQMVCGYALVTVREALAVAPGLSSARIVAVRSAGPDAYGRPRLDCMLASRITRIAFKGVQWATADAATIINGISSELLISQKGASKEMVPLDLSKEPELAALLSLIDPTELSGSPGY